MKVLLVLILLLVSVDRSECVRCFARFDLTSGQCDEELGNVDEDDCCQNPHYGYKTADGACQSCGPPVWSSWSSWSQCNVLCGDGVRQRNRTCFGIGESECDNAKDNLQMEPCNGTCCNTEGWGLWLNWSPCSVTCGGGGVRKRERVCSSSLECRSACSGPSGEAETCPTLNTCPVHGGWSSWSGWSDCSGSCINGERGDLPSRRRYRSCSNPIPSNNTVPPGDSCPGDNIQEQNCSELPNCPVDGNWGGWSPPEPCTVTCGEGLQLSTRTCNNPVPKYGGRFCEGTSAKTTICQSPCPVDGFWSGWSNWGECSSSCISQDRIPTRTRHRSCSNPAPSSKPPGRPCQGDDREIENCSHQPYCSVDGVWGSWSPFTSCSITCGEGLQLSTRMCNNPVPKYGGRFCEGTSAKTTVCQSPCPVDGFWSGWSNWGECSSSCISQGRIPTRTRQRSCSNPAPSSKPPGRPCQGDDREIENCSHQPHCSVDGVWGSWSPFTPCPVTCGVGLQVSNRNCDSPAPKHGGQPCPGERHRTSICTTSIHCPGDHLWFTG
ncbi:properdin-like isoform X2 [Channa argus]|uniref:properdin-like isoform X2 n=1 Tax=Channa argus TaxID=215402 RepID=UPI00351FA5EC